jgi:hypothetical protein
VSVEIDPLLSLSNNGMPNQFSRIISVISYAVLLQGMKAISSVRSIILDLGPKLTFSFSQVDKRVQRTSEFPLIGQ